MELENTTPSNLQEAADAAIKSFESNNDPSAQTIQDPSQEVQSLTDINKLEKFIYEGKEYTPAELKKMVMFQNDYTKKTQEFSKIRKEYDSIKPEYEQSKKYRDNLAIDLESVKNDPSLASKFLEVYPKEYHRLLDYITKAEQQESKAVDPRVDSLLKEINELKDLKSIGQELREEKVEKASLELDSAFDKYTKQYPLSNEPDVVVALERILSEKVKQAQGSGENVRRVKLDSSDYERVFKASHEYHSKRFDNHYSQQFNKQKETNQMAKTSGSGGSIPTGAPQSIKTFKDAEAAAMEAMKSGAF